KNHQIIENIIQLLKFKEETKKNFTIVFENKKIDIEINKLKNENKLLSTKLDNYLLKTELLEKRNYLEENGKTNEKINLIEADLRKYEKMYKETAAKTQQCELLQKQFLEYKKVGDEITSLEKKKEMFTKYLSCINAKDGIPYKILKKSCSTIEQGINNILSEITDFNISLGFDLKKFKIMITDKNKIIPAEQGSGFQKFIIDLSMRLCLACNHPCLPNFFIIDEGFGCMDREHLENTKNFMESFNLQNKFNWMILISHIEDLHNITNKNIEINFSNGKSKLLVGHIPEFPEPTITAIDTENNEDIIKVEEDSEKLYCEVCQKSFKNTSNAKTRHLATKIHNKNLLKFRFNKKVDEIDINITSTLDLDNLS